MNAHPEIVDKKSDSPDEDKCAHDSKLLIPTLKDFFKMHPLISSKDFLGDAAFDTLPLYKDLLTGDTYGISQHFHSAYIPLNKRSACGKSDQPKMSLFSSLSLLSLKSCFAGFLPCLEATLQTCFTITKLI